MPKSQRIATEGIILRSHASGDSNLVISVLSKELGKISLFARGAQKNSRKSMAHLDVFDAYYLELRQGKASSLYNILHKRPRTSFAYIRNSLHSITLASLVCESFSNLLIEDDERGALENFTLLDNTLQALNAEQKVACSLSVQLQATYRCLKELLRSSGYLDDDYPDGGSKKYFIKLLHQIELASERRLRSTIDLERLFTKLEAERELSL